MFSIEQHKINIPRRKNKIVERCKETRQKVKLSKANIKSHRSTLDIQVMRRHDISYIRLGCIIPAALTFAAYMDLLRLSPFIVSGFLQQMFWYYLSPEIFSVTPTVSYTYCQDFLQGLACHTSLGPQSILQNLARNLLIP